MTGLFKDLFGSGFNSSDPLAARAMSEEELIKLEADRIKTSKEDWDRLSDKEKLHYRALMGGAAATEKEKN